MRRLSVIIFALCVLSSPAWAGGVYFGYSQSGGHFVLGGGYKHPTYGVAGHAPRDYHGGHYGYQRHHHYGHGHGYGYHYGHGHHHGSCGHHKSSCHSSGCGHHHSHGAREIIQCDANNANCQQVKLFSSW